LEAGSVAWILPPSEDDAATAEGLVTGTILGSYRFDEFKTPDPDNPFPPAIKPMTLIASADFAGAAEPARACPEAQNRAPPLPALPSNAATPSYRGRRAREVASAHPTVTAEVLGRKEMVEKKMGGLVAVSQGSAEEPQLIVLRYEGGGSAPTLGLVGKGVTF